MLASQIGSAIEIHTPAKLNLFLEVLFRRNDGFHEIETLMTSISIFDTICFSTRTDKQLRFTCSWSSGTAARFGGPTSPESVVGDLPTGTDNLVLAAVERLRQVAGTSRGASIRLIKRIPSAAGLGGASSDAAAALVAANRVWRLGWDRGRLSDVAAEIGSDAPFFLDGGAAVCRGRGERVEPVEAGTGLHLAVVRPPIGLATPRVFQECRLPSRPERIEPMLRALESGVAAQVGRHLMNRLQEPAERISPWIGRMKSLFNRLDCLGHQMSGSGSCYFGVCRNAHHARRVARILRAAGIGFAVPVTTVAARRLHASLS